MGLDGPQGSPVGEIFQLRAVTSCEVLGKKCHPTQLAEATWRLGDLMCIKNVLYSPDG